MFKKSWLVVLVALVIGVSTSCQKEQDDIDPNAKAVVTFGLDINEQVANFGLKNGSMPAFTHPLNIITVEMTNLDNGDVFTDTFTDIDAMSMVVVAGNYKVTVANPDAGVVADYMHFTAEKNVVITGDETIVVHAVLYQSLLTVSNAQVVPTVSGTELFFDQNMHFAYITNWNSGEWNYDGKDIHTSLTPEIAKRYHFTVTQNDIVVEGIGDWENGNQSYIDRIVAEDLYDANNTNGFLLSMDPSQPVWKWQRGDASGAANITPPIAYALENAGYHDIAILGYESVWNDLNNGNRFWSSSLYGLIGGYNAIGDQKFLDMATAILPAVAAKYHPAGTAPARPQYWGYDYINLLKSAKMAAEAGVPGAQTYLDELTADYLANYETYATNDYHRIFINAIANDLGLGIGNFQGIVDWDENEYGLQGAAYGLMGQSWEVPSTVKSYILGNLETAHTSESLAEAVYAVGL